MYSPLSNCRGVLINSGSEVHLTFVIWGGNKLKWLDICGTNFDLGCGDKLNKLVDICETSLNWG